MRACPALLTPHRMLLVCVITIIQPFGRQFGELNQQKFLYLCLYLYFSSGLTPCSGSPWGQMSLRASMKRWWRKKSKPATSSGKGNSSWAVMWNSICSNAGKFEVNTSVKSLWGRCAIFLHIWKNGCHRYLMTLLQFHHVSSCLINEWPRRYFFKFLNGLFTGYF